MSGFAVIIFIIQNTIWMNHLKFFRVGLLRLSRQYNSIMLHTHDHLKLILAEGPAGEAWGPSHNEILSRISGTNSTGNHRHVVCL